MKVEVLEVCLKGGTILKENYEIEKVISKGKLSITYLGNDLYKETNCIIKEYFPEKLALRDMDNEKVVCKSLLLKEKFYDLKDIFFNEGEILKKLKHKSISSYIDHFEENDTSYIVIKYYEGKTLDEYIKENNNISILYLLKKIFIPIANAINYMHKKGIIHRDIKPSNIIMDKHGDPLIIDFGSSINYRICNKKNIFITPGFSPLEFYSEESKQSRYSDVYSFAATLYYCLCGKVPISVTERLIEDKIENIRNYNQEISLLFSKVIMKNLSVNFKERIPSLNFFKVFIYLECIRLKIKILIQRINKNNKPW
ncbi:serine/threonine protein kinase [Clostridium sp. PL3]|uniref:Serine/threonine protein kinase n=1 Tax=Clostridium thailandense TaxID=2794346 RepID=A0A949TU12_9CLOT|nr:serine/threonine-protein kinase [Clostridium thailandense]MBV7275337.1 serine/threonine protein kinase [Clostridium thailandense]